jgi:photosystem II stability/assembly factor-like uncharacterized protein
MLSVMSSLVLASSLLAQTPAVQSTAQPQAETVTAQGAPALVTKPTARAQSGAARAAGLNARLAPAPAAGQARKVSPAAQAVLARLATARQSEAAKPAKSVKLAGDDAAAQTHVPYQFTGPGWIKHPLTDAEQLRRFGAIVTPAPRGGEENQPEHIAPEVRAQFAAKAAAATRAAAPSPYAPRDLCDDLLAARASPQRYQPLGPAPLGGDDIVTDPKSLNQNEFWSQMPASGRVTAIACDPFVPSSNVLIATTGGGLWKTENAQAGVSTVWRNVSDSVIPTTSDTLGISAFGALAYAPTDSTIVYAADGSYLDLIEGSGLFRSMNGGNTWTRIGFDLTGAREVLSQLLVSPLDPNVIYVGYSDSTQDGFGMLSRVNLKYKPDGTLDSITETFATDDSGSRITAAVTGIVWTALGYPLVAFDGLGVYLWIDDAEVAVPVARSIFGQGGRDFRRIMLASNPAGTRFLAASVGSGGNLVQAVRCNSVELNAWEALPQGSVDELGDHGLPNAFATYGSLTGFVTINPEKQTQAIIGGVSPYFADAGMVISDDFLTEIVSSGETKAPSWYEMTRSDATPSNVVTDALRSKVVRGIHPYQNAAAWDSNGNLWIGHGGGVCMVERDNLGLFKAPTYVDKNGGAAGNPERFPTVAAGALNTMLTTASTLSPHDTNLLITGTENNGAGQLSPIIAPDPNAGGILQNNFIAITADDEQTADTTVEPPEIQGRWLGAETGPLVFDPRDRLGQNSGESAPAQIYITAPTLTYNVFRRNHEKTEYLDPVTLDPLAPEIEAGTIGTITGDWIFDRRDNYPPLVSAKFTVPLDDTDGINPKFDSVFGGLITGTSRLWMIADAAQFRNPTDKNSSLPPVGDHAKWAPVQASAGLLIEPITSNLFRRGTVTSIGFAKKQGSATADDLSVIWFTSTSGRLLRLVADVDPDLGEVIVNPKSRLPNYIRGQKVYPGEGDTFSPYRASDVVVNPRNKNQVYVSFRMPFEIPTADLSGIRVARIAKVTITPDIDINGDPIEVITVAPVSATLPLGLEPRSIAVTWGTGGNPDIIYVGTGSGLFSSDDGGATWRDADPVLPNAQVRDIHLVSDDSGNASNGNMVVSFYGRGVWYSPRLAQTCLGDFNRDSILDFQDIDAFVDAFNLGCSVADINVDGVLTSDDFDAFVAGYEAGCS